MPKKKKDKNWMAGPPVEIDNRTKEDKEKEKKARQPRKKSLLEDAANVVSYLTGADSFGRVMRGKGGDRKRALAKKRKK